MGITNQIEHGTYEMFKQGKCKCDPCRHAQQERRRLIKLEYARNRRKEHPEFSREASKKWRENNREKSVAIATKWNNENKEKHRANARAYARRHDAKVKERNKKWRQANPEIRNLLEHKRKANKLNNGVFEVTGKDWKKMLSRYNHSCIYCGEKGKMTMDHVVPLSRGGRHSIGNLVPSCGPCNFSKNKKFITEWKKVS
jgi:5-methylcytosine-specific restriction endonuclease McrA